MAALLSACFTPGDPLPLETEGESTSTGEGTAGPSSTDPTTPSTTDPTSSTSEPSTSGPTTGPTTSGPGESSSETTAVDESTSTDVEPACGDRTATPGELCLDVSPNSLMAPPMPVDVALGDISSNGLLDIVVLARGPEADSDIVVTLEADGVGGFATGTTEVVPTPAARLRLGDLDGDDDLDVVVHAGDIVWLRNQGSFFSDASIASNFAGGWQVSDLFIADLDDDGILDVGYTEAYGRVWVSGALSNGSWVPDVSSNIPGPGEGAAGMAVGAISQDGDDDLDVIAFNQYYSSALVVTNGGDGSFTVGPDVPLCPANIDGVRYGDIADFNDDGFSDVVVTCMDGDGAVTLGSESGFDAPVALPLAGAFKPFVVDLDGDGDQDVLVSSTTLDRAVAFLNDGTGSFELADVQFMAPGPVYGVAADDMNDDGAMDVVVVSAQDGPGRVDVYLAEP